MYMNLNLPLSCMFPLDKVYTKTSLQCPSTFRWDNLCTTTQKFHQLSNIYLWDISYMKLHQPRNTFQHHKKYTILLHQLNTFQLDKEYIKMNPVSMNMFQLDRVYMKSRDFYNR